MRSALLLAALFLATPLLAGAHAFGVSHEATTPEGVHVDIGYSAAAPMVGESVIFDFNLPADEADEEYTDIWVRIEKEGSVKLATAIYNAEFGGPRMSYVFPEAGDYLVSVRYENGGDAVAKSEWTIPVVPEPKGPFDAIPWFGFLAAGLAAGAAAAYLLARTRR